MARMILIALGSSGDVHPVLGIAEELARRHHEVFVVTNPSFESLVKRLGFQFRPLGTAAEFDAVADDPDVWHPVRGIKMLVRWAILHTMRPIYELLEELHIPDQTVVAAPLTAFGARIAQEKFGIRLATLHLQPVVFRSVYDTPRIPPMLTGPRVPHWLKRLQFYLADRLLVDPILTRETNAFRGELGLRPVQRLMNRWCHSPDCVIGLFPDWYASLQADWPPNTHLTGFPLWDESVLDARDQGLQKFLEAGTPPLVFTPGSAMRHGKDFFEVAVAATEQLGKRAILLSQHAAHIPVGLPAGIVHFPYVPFSQLLPQAAALVHHGGIGSTGQALSAGIPQLIMAMAFDQPDNANRVQRLGVGGGLSRHQFQAPRVTKMLDRMLGCPEMSARCKQVAGHFSSAKPIPATADLIEQMLTVPRSGESDHATVC
ncbi:MAG: hypothetical protein CBB70_07265 [Planctomycetaceae bacterium TMED10]|nr:MAG: hypothetical protein CBB70_07265 [Planctomycetaceae bacterium TMED10]